MAVINEALATSTAITITLASLASSATAGRESASVDNSSNLYLDALVQVKAKLATGTPANDKAIYIYVAGSEDGTKWVDTVTGADAAITLRDPTNLTLLGVINTPDAGAVTYVSNPMAVAAAFGGTLPRKWSIIIRNYTGLAFDATAGNLAVTYSGVTATVV
jgi:hypothetical protein